MIIPHYPDYYNFIIDLKITLKIGESSRCLWNHGGFILESISTKKSNFLVEIVFNAQINLGKLNILTVLCLLIQENSKSLHLFRDFLSLPTMFIVFSVEVLHIFH